jgi:hypothetical protein
MQGYLPERRARAVPSKKRVSWLTLRHQHAIVSNYLALLPRILAGRVSFCIGVIQETLLFEIKDAINEGATKKRA